MTRYSVAYDKGGKWAAKDSTINNRVDLPAKGSRGGKAKLCRIMELKRSRKLVREINGQIMESLGSKGVHGGTRLPAAKPDNGRKIGNRTRQGAYDRHNPNRYHASNKSVCPRLENMLDALVNWGSESGTSRVCPLLVGPMPNTPSSVPDPDL